MRIKALQRGIFFVTIILSLGVFINIALSEKPLRQEVEAATIPVSANITANTTWSGGNTYNVTASIAIVSPAVLTITPGAGVVTVTLCTACTITINSGASIKSNGTSGTTNVIFKHVTGTVVASWTGAIIVSAGGSFTASYSTFQYGDVPLRCKGTCDVSNSTFVTNRVGISVYNLGSLTTVKNTFNANTYTPIAIEPEYGVISLGAGANADILGTGATNKNGYNGIGISYPATDGANSGTVCTSNICDIPIRNFAGYNMPYVVLTNYNVTGASKVFRMNVPNLVIKFLANIQFQVLSGAKFDIAGDGGVGPVYFTAATDDTIGTGGGAGGSGVLADTNNDGSATTPVAGFWSRLSTTSTTASTISYGNIRYSAFGVNISGTGVSATVGNSFFYKNNVGISVQNKGGVTTLHNTFNNQTYTPVEIEPETTPANIVFGSGANADILGTGTNKNAFNGIGFGYTPSGEGANTAATCPSTFCDMPAYTFAGKSNQTWILLGPYTVSTSGDSLRINTPGVVVKGGAVAATNNIIISSGAKLVVSGTFTYPIVFTSIKDDTYGGGGGDGGSGVLGDNNNDGSGTAPAAGNWAGLAPQGAGANVLSFVIISYATYGVNLTGTSFSLTDAWITNNSYGLYLNTTGAPTLTRINLTGNTTWAGYNAQATAKIAQNLWWGAASGPLDSTATGSCTNPAGTGNKVSDTAALPLTYCPFATTAWNQNVLPTTSGVQINGGAAAINLTENSTTNVVCTGTITDSNGYANIKSVEGRFYRTGVGVNAAANDANMYIVSGDANCVPSAGTGNTETYTCTFPVKFFAESTDGGTVRSLDTWSCTLIPSDYTGVGTSATAVTEMNSLVALSIAGSINYGSVSSGGNTGSSSQPIVITNTGNIDIDATVQGNNLCSDYPTCAAGNVIPGANQQFKSSNFTYGGGTSITVGTPQYVGFNIPPSTVMPSNSTANIYWGLAVPSNLKPGSYTGQNIITAVNPFL